MVLRKLVSYSACSWQRLCAMCYFQLAHELADEPGSAVCPLGGGKHSGSSDWLAAVCHSVDVCVRFNAYASASVCKCIYLKKKISLQCVCIISLHLNVCVLQRWEIL